MSNKYASACDFFLLMIAPRSVEKSCKSISTLRFQPCHVLSSAWTQWIFQGQTSHSSLLSRDAAPSFEAHQILVGILRLLPEMPSLRLSKCLPECYFFISRSLNTCQGVPIAAMNATPLFEVHTTFVVVLVLLPWSPNLTFKLTDCSSGSAKNNVRQWEHAVTRGHGSEIVKIRMKKRTSHSHFQSLRMLPFTGLEYLLGPFCTFVQSCCIYWMLNFSLHSFVLSFSFVVCTLSLPL